MARFTVEGRGEFPFDMLRHGACWPTNTEAAGALVGRDRRRVELQCQASRDISPRRWRSFNWNVVELDGEPVTEEIEILYMRSIG